MNYLDFINKITIKNPYANKVNFLVSGNDQLVNDVVLHDLVSDCYKEGNRLIIIDDTGKADKKYLEMVHSFGYQIKNGMSGEYCLYNPFKISTVKGLSKVRQLLSILGYDEKQKGKIIAYLNFIRHIEYLDQGSYDVEITLDILGMYCTSIAVREELENLQERGIIDADQKMLLLAKYSECSMAAADFEDMFFVIRPFIYGRSMENTPNQAFVFQTGELGEDDTIRNVVMQLVQFGLEEEREQNTTLLIFDKGYGSRKCVFNLINVCPKNVSVHVFSEDIFTLCDDTTLAMILNRFAARVYSRHNAMSSAESVEKLCGEVDVIKNTYNVAYDRRWHANRPWDVLFGNNKTETYTQMAPVREPRYRKEMVMSLMVGQCIIDYMGNTSLFVI